MFSFPLKVNLITSCSLNYVIKKNDILTCVSRIVINDPLVSNSSGYTILLIVRCLVIVTSHSVQILYPLYYPKGRILSHLSPFQMTLMISDLKDIINSI